MKPVMYFDLGLYKCEELRWMVESILPDLEITEYVAHGFEACHVYAKRAFDYFVKNEKVTIHKIAIGGFNGPNKLYHAKNKLGHSLYSTKSNVDKRDFEVVIVRKFSTWLKKSGINLDDYFVIMKINIEGAEYELFKDLIKTGIIKKIDMVCGSIDDITKIGGYSEEDVKNYYRLLDNNGIRCIPFTEYKPTTKKLMRDILWQKLK